MRIAVGVTHFLFASAAAANTNIPDEGLQLLQVGAAKKAALQKKDEFSCDLCADSENEFDATGKKGKCQRIFDRAQKNSKRCEKRKNRPGVIRGCCPDPPVECDLCPAGSTFNADNLDGKCAKIATRSTKNEERCNKMKGKKRVQKRCCDKEGGEEEGGKEKEEEFVDPKYPPADDAVELKDCLGQGNELQFDWTFPSMDGKTVLDNKAGVLYSPDHPGLNRWTMEKDGGEPTADPEGVQRPYLQGAYTFDKTPQGCYRAVMENPQCNMDYFGIVSMHYDQAKNICSCSRGRYSKDPFQHMHGGSYQGIYGTMMKKHFACKLPKRKPGDHSMTYWGGSQKLGSCALSTWAVLEQWRTPLGGKESANCASYKSCDQPVWEKWRKDQRKKQAEVGEGMSRAQCVAEIAKLQDSKCKLATRAQWIETTGRCSCVWGMFTSKSGSAGTASGELFDKVGEEKFLELCNKKNPATGATYLDPKCMGQTCVLQNLPAIGAYPNGGAPNSLDLSTNPRR